MTAPGVSSSKSLAGAGSLCGEQVGPEASLYGEVQGIMGNGHMGPNMDKQTDTNDCKH